jgi:two-component system NarL family response regulator
MNDVTTIALVVGQPLLRDGVRSLLEREPGLHLVGTFDSPAALSATLAARVLVVDVGVPHVKSLEAVRELAARFPGSGLVGLSRCVNRRQVEAMRTAGVRAWLVEGSNATDLTRAIHAVARDEAWRPTPLPEPVELSPREEEVLRLLAEGLTSKEMANKLEVALSTVETYRKQLMNKLALHSIAALTRYAVRTGLASLD